MLYRSSHPRSLLRNHCTSTGFPSTQAGQSVSGQRRPMVFPAATTAEALGAWFSLTALESPGWPSYAYQVFETIKSIWERSKRSSISISHCEFFQQEIKALPKKVLQTHPTIGPQKVDNYVRTHLSDNWWCLQQAIEKSVQITDDPRPMPFIIASNFNKFVGKPKTYADIAAAKAKRISD